MYRSENNRFALADCFRVPVDINNNTARRRKNNRITFDLWSGLRGWKVKRVRSQQSPVSHLL